MKWTVKLERVDEAGNFHSTTIGHVERPELRSEADLGLTHEDGKYLTRRPQAEIAHDQIGVGEERAPAETQAFQRHLRRASRNLPRTITNRTQVELKQMNAFPTHRDLDHAMQPTKREGRGQVQPAPHHRAEAQQPYLKLQDRAGLLRHGGGR